MSDSSRHIAVDLGAESGRIVVGTIAEGRIDLEEIHRFPNRPVRLPDGMHWNIQDLYQQILVGLRLARQRFGSTLSSIGVDSWGADYGLLDRAGRLLGIPYHYRDERTDGVAERAEGSMPAEDHFRRTGIARLPFNTVFQLLAQRLSGDESLDRAHALVMIPDLLHFWLTGEVAAEYTDATTTDLLETNGAWSREILECLNLPGAILQSPTQPGTVLGPLRSAVCWATGMEPLSVILPATHDTASAVVGIPFEKNRTTAYISSGTWSLLGLELDHPVLSSEARSAQLSNEGGACSTFRFQKNIMGLWLVQECQRIWSGRGAEHAVEDLVRQASVCSSPGVVIDVNNQCFFHPADMPNEINVYLRRTGQEPIENHAAMVRAILEGLALAYRETVGQLERLAETRIDCVHIVGGGVRNALLCQLTADACELPVLAGPVEATALGNVVMQALGSGRIGSIAEGRALVHTSSRTVLYQPRASADWEHNHAQLNQYRLTE